MSVPASTPPAGTALPSASVADQSALLDGAAPVTPSGTVSEMVIGASALAAETDGPRLRTVMPHVIGEPTTGATVLTTFSTARSAMGFSACCAVDVLSARRFCASKVRPSTSAVFDSCAALAVAVAFAVTSAVSTMRSEPSAFRLVVVRPTAIEPSLFSVRGSAEPVVSLELA